MGHTSNKINSTGGVGLGADIKYVLGESSRDLGTLCTSNKINPWAKYKPYRSTSTITTEQARANAYYGLSIDTFDTISGPTTQGAFLYELFNNNLKWKHAAPRGLATYSEWYRALDFDGYYHDAICPIVDVDTDNIPINTSGDATITWDLIDDSSLDSGNLTLTDIKVNNVSVRGNYYLGVVLKNGSTYKVVTASTKVGSGDVNIELSNAQSLAGTWDAYPFFSSVPITLDGNLVTGTYFSAGWDDAPVQLTFRLTSESLQFEINGTWDSTYTHVSVEWTAINQDSASKTVTPTVNIRRNQNGSVEPVTEDDELSQSVSLGSITVPGNSTISGGPVTIDATTMIHSYDPSYFWWTICSIPNTSYTPTYNQIEEPDEPLLNE